MLVLNLTNPNNSAIKYELNKFPDGQQSITLLQSHHFWTLKDKTIKIYSRLLLS